MLALPKLNMQFLTFPDYLLRNFNLFRYASVNMARHFRTSPAGSLPTSRTPLVMLNYMYITRGVRL